MAGLRYVLLLAALLCGADVSIAQNIGRLPLDQDGNRVFKMTMLALSQPTDFTWSYRHNLGRLTMIDSLLSRYKNLRVESQYLVYDETDENLPAAMDDWGRTGQHLVIATSFGFQDQTLAAASRWPNTNWVHVSGFKTGTPNFATAWCRVYQSRYLTGIAAAGVSDSGVIGYVAAFPFIPEVVRGFNAFTIGARKYNPRTRVLVNFLMAWHDSNRTRLASEWLRTLGCDTIAGHTNDRSLYDPFITRGLMAAGYYADMREQYGDNVVLSAFFDWGPMYTRMAESTIAGQYIDDAFDGMERGVPVTSNPSQFVGAAARNILDFERTEMLRGADMHPVHGGSAKIFCGPLNDEYGVPMLHNSSDCADLFDHPHPSFQQFGGGLLNMEWFVEGIEDLGVVTLAHEDCAAGHKYTWIPEGKRVMDNSRHQGGPTAPGIMKLRFAFSCEPCPSGTYAADPGSARCHQCPAGSASPGQTAANNATACRVCPEGTFATAGAGECSPCPAGFLNHGTGNSDCPVPEETTSWVSENWWVLVIVVVGALILIGVPVVYKFTEQQRRMMRLYNNNAVAESCALSIAEMRLEEVEYIKEIKNPNKIQQAFIMIVNNLVEYRRYLPASLLEQDDEEEEPESGSDVGAGSPGKSGAHKASRNSSRDSLSRSRGSNATGMTGVSKMQVRDVKNDAKFQLALKPKRIAVLAVNCLDPTPSAEWYGEWFAVLESAAKPTKGYMQAFNETVYISWNTAFATGQSPAMAGNAAVSIKEAWYGGGHERSQIACGLTAQRAVCGNAGTETARHYIIVDTAAVLLASLLRNYSQVCGYPVLADERAVKDMFKLKARQIDVIAPSYGPAFAAASRGKGGSDPMGLFEVAGREAAGECDEWMYELDKAAQATSIYNAFTGAWAKVIQGMFVPDVVLGDVKEAAEKNAFNLTSDWAWQNLQQAVQDGAQGALQPKRVTAFEFRASLSATPV